MTSGKEEQEPKTKKVLNPSQNEKKNIKSNPSVCENKYLISVIAVIVAFVALAIAAYTLFLNRQLQNTLNTTQNSFSTQLQQTIQKQEQVQEQINEKTNSATEIQTQLQNKFEHLSKQLQNAMKQKFYQNQDWVLLKARYYLELAEINSHWNNGTESTIALLEQADQLLKQLNEPKILNVRQAIAKDIAQTQALPMVDTAGLLSQLDAAQNSVNDLRLPLPTNANLLSNDNTKSQENKSPTWRAGFQSTMNALQKLIVIRRHDQEIQPIMSPLFEAILKEKLQLNLQEAQWAVLNNDSYVFQLVLKQAINTLKRNFNENTANTAALIKKLTELQQTNITPKRPAMGTALPMLNELIDTKKSSIDQSPSSYQGGNQ